MSKSRKTANTPTEQNDLSADANLVQAILSGDQDAIQGFVDRYHRLVYQLSHRIVPNANDANDVTKETFRVALTRLKQFRFNSGLDTWLLRIATGEALKLIRRRKNVKITFSPATATEISQGVNASPRDEAIVAKVLADLGLANKTPDKGSGKGRVNDRLARSLKLLHQATRPVEPTVSPATAADIIQGLDVGPHDEAMVVNDFSYLGLVNESADKKSDKGKESGNSAKARQETRQR